MKIEQNKGKIIMNIKANSFYDDVMQVFSLEPIHSGPVGKEDAFSRSENNRRSKRVSRYLFSRYNERFSKVALKEGDLHWPLPEGINLQEILCLKDIWTINNGYLARWKGRKFLHGRE